MDQAPMDIYVHSISSPSLRPDSFIGWDSFPKSIFIPLPLPPSLARFISSYLISLQIFRSKRSARFLNTRPIVCSILLSSHTHISSNQNSSSVKPLIYNYIEGYCIDTLGIRAKKKALRCAACYERKRIAAFSLIVVRPSSVELVGC